MSSALRIFILLLLREWINMLITPTVPLSQLKTRKVRLFIRGKAFVVVVGEGGLLCTYSILKTIG